MLNFDATYDARLFIPVAIGIKRQTSPFFAPIPTHPAKTGVALMAPPAVATKTGATTAPRDTAPQLRHLRRNCEFCSTFSITFCASRLPCAPPHTRTYKAHEFLLLGVDLNILLLLGWAGRQKHWTIPVLRVLERSESMSNN